MDTARFPILVKSLYMLVAEFEKMFPGRPFTPDGHMVGSIGECLAAYYYGVELCSPSTPGHDCTAMGRRIEIKATQGSRSVALRSEPEHLLVLRLLPTGEFQEIYNGPGSGPWSMVSHKQVQKNGQRAVGLGVLRSLMKGVPERDRLPRRVIV